MANALASITTLYQQYRDNQDYWLDGSIAKARLFLFACREIVLRRPTLSSVEGNQVQLTEMQLRKDIDECSSWLKANGAARGTNGRAASASRYYDTSDIRSR